MCVQTAKIEEYEKSRPFYASNRELAERLGVSVSTIKRARARRHPKSWDLKHWKRDTPAKDRAFLGKALGMMREGWKFGVCHDKPDAVAVLGKSLIAVKVYGWNRCISEEQVANRFSGFDKVFIYVGEADHDDALVGAIRELEGEGARVVRVYKKPYAVAVKDGKIVAVEVVKVVGHKLSGGMTYNKIRQMHEDFDGVLFVKYGVPQ